MLINFLICILLCGTLGFAAYYGIESIMYALGIDGGDDIAHQGLRLYEIALDVLVSHLKHEYLITNYQQAWAVFLQLCKLLSLLETPMLQKLVDPSLFIRRFAERSSTSARVQLDLLEQLTSGSNTSPADYESDGTSGRPTIREQLANLVQERDDDFTIPC